MTRHLLILIFTALLTVYAAEPSKIAAPKKEKPFTPGGVYREGDMQRPRPTVITPEGGDIDTKDKFGSCQIHLEWATPAR